MKTSTPVYPKGFTGPRLAVRSPALSTVAQLTAAWHLGPLGDRWLHTIGVARRAADLADLLGLHADVLVAAAWLHDIGYAKQAVVTGFHPLDGAHFLAGQLWPSRITGLVAHHSGARFVATARGLRSALAAYPDEGGLMSDVLTYADQTVGPQGQQVTLAQRRAELLGRQGADSRIAAVEHVRGPVLRAAAARVERRLAPPEIPMTRFEPALPRVSFGATPHTRVGNGASPASRQSVDAPSVAYQ
ncbi:MAG TPA: HD domain-containing protein [Actinoplanes sp.]